jgi:hypothetical protein
MKTVYRIEKPDETSGMWYTKEGVMRKTIHILCPYGRAKDLPMPYNLLHKKDGEVWISTADSKDNMNYFFTTEDAINLYNNGYKLFEFKASMYQYLEHEVLICRKGIISQKEIPLETLWDIHGTRRL